MRIPAVAALLSCFAVATPAVAQQSLPALPMALQFGLATTDDRLIGFDDRESVERRTTGGSGTASPQTVADWLLRDSRQMFSVGLQGGGISGFRDAVGGQSNFHFNEGIAGIALDRRLGEHWMIGVDVGYGGGQALSAQGSVSKTTQTAGITSAYEGGPLFVQLNALWDWDSYDRISLLGGNPALSGQASGHSWGAAAKGGWLFDLGSLRLGPVGGLAMSTAYIEGFRESGSATTLAVSPMLRRLVTGEIGGELQYGGLGSGVVAPRLRVTYQSSAMDQRRDLVVSNNGPIAVLPLAEEPKARLHLSTGLDGHIARGLTAGVAYDALMGNGGVDQRLSADLHMAF